MVHPWVSITSCFYDVIYGIRDKFVKGFLFWLALTCFSKMKGLLFWFARTCFSNMKGFLSGNERTSFSNVKGFLSSHARMCLSKANSMLYGVMVWHPWLIVAQIVCLQCSYYITLGVFLSILVGTRVSRLSLVYFFDYVTITTSTVTGWCVIASFLLSSFAGSVYMLYIIERAKKCLDFSATLYIIHLFICIVYGGWPSSITWWIVNGAGIAVMALVGEYLCIRRELQEIPITRLCSIEGDHNHSCSSASSLNDLQDEAHELYDYYFFDI